ncbi:MAG TPA: hypothetical protein VK939_11695 [Longimicrobiales bacterium]|nr:hypothetical protein [Longimicrobiales bacterium]
MTDSTPAGVRAPVVIGFLLAGGLLLGLGLFADRIRGGPERGLPDLLLVAPARGDTVSGELYVRFQTSAPLALGRMGWAAGDLHPHLLLDGRELMAAAADIEPTPDGFIWRLPTPEPGEHTLLLTWAGTHHGTLGDTVGRTIRFHVR